MDSTRKKQSRGLSRQLPKRSVGFRREIDHLRFRDQVIDEGIPQVTGNSTSKRLPFSGSLSTRRVP